MRTQVLLLEPDQAVRRMLHFALSSAGYGVLDAGTEEEARAALKVAHPQAVVLDLDRPGGSGAGLLPALRGASLRDRGLPVWVVLSARDRQDVARAYGPLGKRFLAKPFDPKMLINLLEDLLQGA